MPNLYAFNAVVGFFRASGYFAIREHLLKVPKVKILVGINVDHIIAEANRKGMLFTCDDLKTRNEFVNWMQEDIKKAKYTSQVENGILDFMQDLIDRKIEVRAHKSKKLHAKIYIFLPESFNEHSTGVVITGSSNLSDSGIGKRTENANYEFNVELRDYEDVKFANDEFEMLWNESVDILPEDISSIKEKTHINKEFTPYEIFLKFLVEYFDKNIDYDPETIGDIPNKFKKLTYQVDAVNQGYNMLMQHNGFILADVVGTGKTVVAAMIAKRFIISNGSSNTKILVVYPPAVEKNWKSTFKAFNIDRYTKFISNGSLNKIIEGDINYWAKEEYDLILVDEAHKFRNHTSQMFQNLQIICKSNRTSNGLIEGEDKKIVLISATPLNNKPDDIYHLLLLFQNARRSSLPVSNLQKFFGRIEQQYRTIKSQDPVNVEALRIMYKEIRDKVIQPITVRRTRKDLENIDQYRLDLESQGVKFPKVEAPKAREYKLDKNLDALFYRTMDDLTNEIKLNYYRYQAILFLKPKIREEFYPQANLVSVSLAYIMKTLLVKRLESSFIAFKNSLGKLLISTERMIESFEVKNKIFIAPDLDVNKLIDEGWTDEEIEEKINLISENKPGNRIFSKEDFESGYVNKLKHDLEILNDLVNEWDKIDYDPKFDVFIDLFKKKLFDKKINPTGKLIVFSESKDTTEYLANKLKDYGISKILTVSSKNRKKLFNVITENFDANYDTDKQKNDYNILITTEVLAEGVNLHRANVIVNYDTPWNSTRLMQRIGRLNRIGSHAGFISNYNFYPSAQSNKEIELKKKAYIKLQGFHTAFGEDSQIYTIEEIIEQFKLYETGISDDEDIRLKYLELIRKIKDSDPALFKSIKNMPLKARTGRVALSDSVRNASICFIKSGKIKDLYFIDKESNVNGLNFEESVKIFEALHDEKSIPIPDFHYNQITEAVNQFEKDFFSNVDSAVVSKDRADARTNYVLKFLREVRKVSENDDFLKIYDDIVKKLEEGVYINLTTELERLRKKKHKSVEEEEKSIIKIARKYLNEKSESNTVNIQNIEILDPDIIISESFI